MESHAYLLRFILPVAHFIALQTRPTSPFPNLNSFTACSSEYAFRLKQTGPRGNQHTFLAGVRVVLPMLDFGQRNRHAILTGVCVLLPVREFAQEIREMNESVVARLRERGNQRAPSDGVCVVLPIGEWVFMGEGGEAVCSCRVSKGDCASFRAAMASVGMDLRWYSGDDIRTAGDGAGRRQGGGAEAELGERPPRGFPYITNTHNTYAT